MSPESHPPEPVSEAAPFDIKLERSEAAARWDYLKATLGTTGGLAFIVLLFLSLLIIVPLWLAGFPPTVLTRVFLV